MNDCMDFLLFLPVVDGGNDRDDNVGVFVIVVELRVVVVVVMLGRVVTVM